MNRVFTAVVLAGILMASGGVLPQAFASTFEAWEFRSLGEVLAMSAMQDMSGDGIGEFVAAAEKSIYLVNGATGKEIWNHATGNSRWITITSMPSLDLNKDGKPEVLAATKDRFIMILDGASGNQIWNFTASGSSYKPGELCYATVRSASLISDIDKDGIPDIVVVSGSGDQCPKDDWFSVLAISTKSGQKIWEYAHAEVYHGLKDGVKGSSPTVLVDVNKDGTEDVVVIDDHSSLYVINGLTGSVIRTQEIHVFGSIWNLMLVPDISGDGARDVLAFEFIDGAGGPDYASIDAIDLASGKIIWQDKAGDGLYNGGALYAGVWVASSPAPTAIHVAVIQRVESELELLLIDGKTGQDILRFHLGEDKSRDDMSKYYPLATIPDLNSNGYDELVVRSIDPTIRLMDGENLGLIWSHSVGGGNNFISSIPTGIKQRYILVADQEARVLALGALTTIETKLSIVSSEETVILSRKIVVSGSISPPLTGEIVELRYTDPTGFVFVKPLVIAKDGSYSDTINPKIFGNWNAKASFAGEGYYLSSTSSTIFFTVENETSGSSYNVEVKSEDNTSVSYPVGYSIDGGQVDGMSIDKQKKSLDVAITPTEKGELRLELSRSMIDAGDSNFQVYVDGKAAKFAELEKNSEMRVISIPFLAESKQIRVIGTHIVPEFPIVQILLGLALIGVILAIAMQSNRIHVRRW